MPFPRVTIARQQTADRQTNQLQAETAKAARTLNLVLGLPHVVDVGAAPSGDYSTSDPSWNSPIDSFTTPAYKDSSTLSVTNGQPWKAGDIVLVWGRYLYTIGTSTIGTFRFVLNDGTKTIVFPSTFRNVGAAFIAQTEVISGRYVMQEDAGAGNVVMRLQGARNSGTGAVQLLSTSGFTFQVLRSG